MSDVMDADGLLLQAVQDLYDAEAATAERLGAVAAAVSDTVLAHYLEEEQSLAVAQQERLEGIARGLEGEPKGAANLWQRAILDDAERDMETVDRGPLLDIALIGALRKGRQAAAVSYETALGLARVQGHEEEAELLEAARDEAQVADEELAAMLERQLDLLRAERPDEEPDDEDSFDDEELADEDED